MSAFSMWLEMIESNVQTKIQRIHCIHFFSHRQAWISLGDMSKEEAMEQFINLLIERCPMFRPHIEAHHVDNEEKNRQK